MGKNLSHEWQTMAPPLLEACNKVGFDASLFELVIPSNFTIHFKLFEVTISHNYVTFVKLPNGPLIMRDRRQFNTVSCPPLGLRYGGNPLVLYKWNPSISVEENFTPWLTHEVEEAEYPWTKPPHCDYCGVGISELGIIGVHIPEKHVNFPFWGYFRYDFDEKLKNM